MARNVNLRHSSGMHCMLTAGRECPLRNFAMPFDLEAAQDSACFWQSTFPEAVPDLSCILFLQAKEMLEKAGFEKGGQTVVLGGATIAGFFAAACSLPFDFVKTRIQKMEPLSDGTMPYKVRLEV